MTRKEVKKIETIKHEINEVYHLKLKEKKYLSTTMMRVTFTGDNVRSFAKDCVDEYTVMWFIDKESGKTAYPEIKEGKAIYPKKNSVARHMTIRKIRPEEKEIDFDFVLLDKGFKTGWLKKAIAGDSVYIINPEQSVRVSSDYDFYYIVIDQVGLPSLENLMESLPKSSKGIAYIFVPNKDSKYKLYPHPGFEINWIYHDDNSPSMLEIVQSFYFDKDKNIFFCSIGNSRETKKIEHYLKNNPELKHMEGHYGCMGTY